MSRPRSCVALGIDPGIAKLGVALVRLDNIGTRVGYLDTWKTPAKTPDGERLDRLCLKLLQFLETEIPDVVGYEQQMGVQLAIGRDDPEKVNRATPRLHDCCGIVRAASLATDRTRAVYEIAPSSAKVAVLGKGRSRGGDPKARVKAAVKLIVGPNRRYSADAADAVAVAVATGRRWLRDQLVEEAETKELFG